MILRNAHDIRRNPTKRKTTISRRTNRLHVFDGLPSFPPFLLYVRCKSWVTFIWRSFRDDHFRKFERNLKTGAKRLDRKLGQTLNDVCVPGCELHALFNLSHI